MSSGGKGLGPGVPLGERLSRSRLAQRLSLRTYREPLPLREFEDYDSYWHERADEENEVRPRWEIALAKIPDGASVLDVGCGTGGFMRYLLAQRPNAVVRGTDISAAAVDVARAAGLDAFPADLSRERLDRRYDFITAFEVIEHIHEAERVLGNLRDATAHQIIMSLPNVGYIEHRVRLGLFGRFPNTTIMFHAKEHIRHWTVTDFIAWAEHFDLAVVSVEGQKGFPLVPWRRMPRLFAAQVVYTLAPMSRST